MVTNAAYPMNDKAPHDGGACKQQHGHSARCCVSVEGFDLRSAWSVRAAGYSSSNSAALTVISSLPPNSLRSIFSLIRPPGATAMIEPSPKNSA